jgi:hypothetical protein
MDDSINPENQPEKEEEGKKRHWGQAFNCTRYSKMSRRAPSFQDEGTFRGIGCSEFKKKYHLTEKNLNRLMMNGMRYLIQQKCGGYSYEIRHGCEEAFKDYCMYERKNHPAKKGKGRQFTTRAEMDEYNRVLYPFWFED